MILHIAPDQKFIPHFIRFLQRRFSLRGQRFQILMRGSSPYQWPRVAQVDFARGPLSIIRLVILMHRADRIVVHSLFTRRANLLLLVCPWLLPRCLWLIWGADLYRPIGKGLAGRLVESARRQLISRIGGLVTYVAGDYLEARRRYGARGRYFECLLYPSNVVSRPVPVPSSGALLVQVGNSADPMNRHEELLPQLAEIDTGDFNVLCPLSYGGADHAEAICRLGSRLFGPRFRPLMDFMPVEEYLALLDRVDVAIFAQERQQAMGNAINLLGMGKRVYLFGGTTSADMFRRIGVKVSRLEDGIELSRLPPEVAAANVSIIAAYFSHETLGRQWSRILGFRG